jgi:hypothetical protein
MNQYRTTKGTDGQYWLFTRRGRGMAWEVVGKYPTKTSAKEAADAAFQREIAATHERITVTHTGTTKT